MSKPKKKKKYRNKRANLVERVDFACAIFAARLYETPFVKSATVLSAAGGRKPMTLAALAVAAAGDAKSDDRLARAGARMAAALGLADAGTKVLKHCITRSRPDRLVESGEHAFTFFGARSDDWNDFPSGHAARTFAAARALSREYPDALGAALLGASVIGLLKVLKGDHFISDIAAGMVLGTCAEWLAKKAFENAAAQ